MAYLENNDELAESYLSIISGFVERRQILTLEVWHRSVRPTAAKLAEIIAGAPVATQAAATEFLRWEQPAISSAQVLATPELRDNYYRYRDAERGVNILVGSIHSVKGETHTATLVLETHWQREHNLAALVPWLCAVKSGGEGAGSQQSTRLRVHYVAMTRPSHLLCLAMKQTTFLDERGQLDDTTIQRLQQRGWTIKELVPYSPQTA